MLADAGQTTESIYNPVEAASRALRSANAAHRQPTDPVPAKANGPASRAVRSMEMARGEVRLVQADWTTRPAHWFAFASWDEAHAAWCKARQASRDAFIASRRLTTPFLQGAATEERLKSAVIFSRTIEEAFSEAPDLPADVVAACRADEQARQYLEQVRRRAIQTPAYGLDVLAKLRLITGPDDDALDPLETTDVYEAHECPDEFARANEFFALHDDIVRAVAPATAGRDVWSEKLAERNRLVDYVNTTARAAPDEVDTEALTQPEFERGWALTCEISDAPSSDAQARAAQIRLCLRMDEEGLEMGNRAIKLLREVEKSLPICAHCTHDGESLAIGYPSAAKEEAL